MPPVTYNETDLTEPPQLDIEGLNIAVTSGEQAADRKGKGKSKGKGDGVEILSDATLRLKAGQRYALVGRNGSGKSSKCWLLRDLHQRRRVLTAAW